MDIYKRIKRCRRKLNISIKKNGLDSEITRQLSLEIDKMIQEYYNGIEIIEYPKGSDMINNYKNSYLALKNYTKNNKFPIVKEWNIYATDNNYLGNKSLEYISKLDWNYLQIRVERENNIEKN